MSKSVKVCPKCGKEYTEHPAISRRDGVTEICPHCGFQEAIIDWFNNDKNLQRQIFDAIEKDLRKEKKGQKIHQKRWKNELLLVWFRVIYVHARREDIT